MSKTKRQCQHGKPYRSRMLLDIVWCSDACFHTVMVDMARYFTKLSKLKMDAPMPPPFTPKPKPSRRRDK